MMFRHLHREPLALNDAGKAAIKAFRDAKPWRGTESERSEKFATLHRELTRAYDLETTLVRDDRTCDASGTSAHSQFDPRKNRIVLRGRLSVVTYLMLFGFARDADRGTAMNLAHKVFQHYFPRSYAGCSRIGGLLVRA